MSQKEKGALKAVSYMMVITLIGKLLGLVRDQFLAANYSAGMEANAFFTASRIPRIFFDAVFASAISSSFIPIFNEYMQKKGKKEAFALSNNFITIIGLFTTILTVLGILFAVPLTKAFAIGFDEPTTLLCAKLLKILFPSVIFTGVAFSFVGILQSLNEFTIPAAMSIASNGIIILYYLFFNEKFGIFGLTIAFLIGWAAQAFIQIPALMKKGYFYKPQFCLKEEGIQKIFLLMLPVMVSTWIQPINLWINSNFASTLFNNSGVSYIEYANTIYSIVVGVFVLSVVNVIFPKLSRLSVNNKEEEFGQTIHQTMKALAFFLIPMMVGLMCLSEPIVRFIYQRGKFSFFETQITARALFFFSIGMIGFGVQAILSRAFYAQKNGKIPLISGLVSILANIVLCFLLVEKMDVGGLALASALSSTLSALLLVIPMQKRSKGFITKKFLADLCKMILSAAFMSIVVILFKNIISSLIPDTTIGRIFVLAIPTGAGLLVYMGLTWVFKLEESRIAFGFINKLLKR